MMKKANLLGENIIVNASLDNKDLYNTPASIDIITSKEIKSNSSSHLEELTQKITNLNFAGGSSRPRYFQIRGIGERSHYAGEGPPNYSVGFFIDDIDLASSSNHF